MKRPIPTLSDPEQEALNACDLFRDLAPEVQQEALRFYCAQRRSLQKGECLLRLGEPLPAFALVLSGRLQTFVDEADGERLIMSYVEPGECCGESLSYLQLPESPVYVMAMADTELLLLDTVNLRELRKCKSEKEQQLAERFFARLAQRTLDMNSRIRTLSQRTLQDKILTLLTQFRTAARREAPAETAQDAPFTIPFNHSAMAEYLGVDRSSLSRQLSVMREKGILDYHKNQFILY